MLNLDDVGNMDSDWMARANRGGAKRRAQIVRPMTAPVEVGA